MRIVTYRLSERAKEAYHLKCAAYHLPAHHLPAHHLDLLLCNKIMVCMVITSSISGRGPNVAPVCVCVCVCLFVCLCRSLVAESCTLYLLYDCSLMEKCD